MYDRSWNREWQRVEMSCERLNSQGGVLRNGERVNGSEETIQKGDILKIGKRSL